MRLSEAMRRGAALSPQGFITLVDRQGRTCALGAALEAIGRLPGPHETEPETFDYPAEWTCWWKSILLIRCPACSVLIHSGVEQLLGHLNDDHKWTREAIADWVATIEPQATEAMPVEAREAVPT